MFKKYFKKAKDQLAEDKKLLNKSKDSKDPLYQKPPEIKIFNPRKDVEKFDVANTLLNGDIAHVNLSRFSNAEREKFINFVGGVIYAIEGHHKTITDHEYYFSPLPEKTK